MAFKQRTRLVGVVCLVIAVQAAGASAIEVSLRPNKDRYICGEPILLRTTVSNLSKEPFVAGRAFAWGSGFTFYVGTKDFELAPIDSVPAKQALEISTPPRQWELFEDRHWIPNQLGPGESAMRLDILIVPRPGPYRLKACLQDKAGNTYMSSPIEFEVEALTKTNDSISKLGGQDFAVNLGSCIFYAHHVQRIWGGYPPGESLSPEEFGAAFSKILTECRDSVFVEYVRYADIMGCGRGSFYRLRFDPDRAELAEQFIKEYPRSWLLPDLYRFLFFTYVEAKDYRKAAALRGKAVDAAPWATVLASVRQYQLPSNLERLSGGASLSPDPEAKP